MIFEFNYNSLLSRRCVWKRFSLSCFAKKRLSISVFINWISLLFLSQKTSNPSFTEMYCLETSLFQKDLSAIENLYFAIRITWCIWKALPNQKNFSEGPLRMRDTFWRNSQAVNRALYHLLKELRKRNTSFVFPYVLNFYSQVPKYLFPKEKTSMDQL